MTGFGHGEHRDDKVHLVLEMRSYNNRFLELYLNLPYSLRPLEPRFRKKLEAQWSFKVVDMGRRLVAFQDLSEGKITSWKWEFGDGATSTEQHPIHAYQSAGRYVVTLWVEGPEGRSRRAKVWDVAVR